MTRTIENQRADSLDPHRLRFRSPAASAPAAGARNAVDRVAGTIRGVSLLTADREAKGYGIWVDRATLETFRAQLSGRKFKAYATHGSVGLDGTLDEVGLWSNATIDTAGAVPQLRADFTALDAWRKYSEAEFDTLFELAEKVPAEFGASLAFRFTLAWVMPGGSEVPTTRNWSAFGDGDVYFDPPMPIGALRSMPSVRACEVFSADFVDDPAANDGLFSAAQRGAAPAGLHGLARAGAAFNAQFAAMSPAALSRIGMQSRDILACAAAGDSPYRRLVSQTGNQATAAVLELRGKYRAGAAFNAQFAARGISK